MKVRLMTKVSAATLISAIACSIFTGCTEKDLYNPERGKTELKPESEYFDFATTAQVAFDVNYGKIAGGALIEVFTEDPIPIRQTTSTPSTAKRFLKSLQMQTDASPAT